MLKGILFDMDGVLIDSEEYICKAAIAMFAEQGLIVEAEDFIPFVGTGENSYLGGPAAKYNFKIDIEQAKFRTYEIYGQIIKGQLGPLPGVISFIETCRDQGLKLAVATSADKTKMIANLHEMGLSTDSFDACVNGLDVTHKKPDPEIFLKAAGLIGLLPETCLVVEDAVEGIKAGKAAGCRCLGLTTSFSAEELNQADWVGSNLADYPGEALEW